MEQLTRLAGEPIREPDFRRARKVRRRPVVRAGLYIPVLAEADQRHLDALLIQHDILRAEKAVADAADQPMRGGTVDIAACPVFLGHIDIGGLALHALCLLLQPEDGAHHLREAGARDRRIGIERIPRRKNAALHHAACRRGVIRLVGRRLGLRRRCACGRGRNIADQRLGDDLAVVVLAHVLFQQIERVGIRQCGNHQHRQKQRDNAEHYVFHPCFGFCRGRSVLSLKFRWR